MLKHDPAEARDLRTESAQCDLAVVGGGLAGACCAVTAARAGLDVALIQDRPVLGGNASSEVRLWILGATAHMSNNNRWAREGGVIDEILLENNYRNPEGNPVLVDAVILDTVAAEPGIKLFLNTAVFEVKKRDSDSIESVRAFCSQNSTLYDVSASLFCDASGDGIVGYLAGAAFRMGAEKEEEFGERFAPDREFGELLGHSIYYFIKDTGRPVRFVAPSWALQDITSIPRYRRFNTKQQGAQLWWIEYGGRLDTVHDTEAIRWELWRVAYGVWDYIKNSGHFPDAETLTLEWVGLIPGKRESRRFEGDFMLTQRDIIEQREHYDAVSYGGWSIDLHPADGVYSEHPGCVQWHAKGVYEIPYRCMYSRNVRNLFVAGRIISASHVAFGSTRVMGTCAHSAQAVGMAAALCRRNGLSPRDLAEPTRIGDLQRALVRTGQFIPRLTIEDAGDVARTAHVTASSQLRLASLTPDGPLRPLTDSWAMLLPVAAGRMPTITFRADVPERATVDMELRACSRPGNFTPDVVLATSSVELASGTDIPLAAEFGMDIERDQYLFVCLMANEDVAIRCSEQRVTGVLAVANRIDPKSGKKAGQYPDKDLGVESFEFWRPVRRPGGHLFAITVDPPLDMFRPESLVNGVERPTTHPNAWVASFEDASPEVRLTWETVQRLNQIELVFDTDLEHALESVMFGHGEHVMPFCVRRYRIRDAAGEVLAECSDNYQTRRAVAFEKPVETRELLIELAKPNLHIPAALFAIHCYGP